MLSILQLVSKKKGREHETPYKKALSYNMLCMRQNGKLGESHQMIRQIAGAIDRLLQLHFLFDGDKRINGAMNVFGRVRC